MSEDQKEQSEQKPSESSSSEFNPGLHQWQSQDEFIKELETDFADKVDPLNYTQPHYKKREWDNIPPIVPKFCLNLSRHIEGLSQIANHQDKLETVKSIRDFTESNFSRVDSRVSTLDESRTAKETSLTDHLQKVDNFSQDLRREYEKWHASLSYLKSTSQKSKSEEDALIDTFMQHFGQKYDEEKVLRLAKQPEEAGKKVLDKPKMTKEEKEVLAYALDYPRTFSISGFYKLLEAAGKRSFIQDTFDLHNSQIDSIFKENQRQKEYDELLMQTIKDVEKAAADRAQKHLEAQTKVNKHVQKQLETIFGNLKSHDKELEKHHNFMDKQRLAFDVHSGEYGKFVMTTKNWQDETRNMIENNREDLTDTIMQTDQFIGDVSNQLQQDVNNVRKLATETIKNQETELVNKFSGQFEEVQTYVQKELTEIKAITSEGNTNLKEGISKIKLVCSEYFQNYETALEENQLRVKDLDLKYQDWNKMLIEPQSFNDARLYAMETRLQEEEEVRIKETTFMKDCVKKLIYSLEQKDMKSLDLSSLNQQSPRMQSLKVSTEPTPEQTMMQLREAPKTARQSGAAVAGSQLNSEAKLPLLMGASNTTSKNGDLHGLIAPSRGKAATGKKGSMQGAHEVVTPGASGKDQIDIITLKRLNFLRTSIDSEDSKDMAARARLNAVQKRDQRMLELWQHDQEQPSINEIINQMRSEKAKKFMPNRFDLDNVTRSVDDTNVSAPFSLHEGTPSNGAKRQTGISMQDQQQWTAQEGHRKQMKKKSFAVTQAHTSRINNQDQDNSMFSINQDKMSSHMEPTNHNSTHHTGSKSFYPNSPSDRGSIALHQASSIYDPQQVAKLNDKLQKHKFMTQKDSLDDQMKQKLKLPSKIPAGATDAFWKDFTPQSSARLTSGDRKRMTMVVQPSSSGQYQNQGFNNMPNDQGLLTARIQGSSKQKHEAMTKTSTKGQGFKKKIDIEVRDNTPNLVQQTPTESITGLHRIETLQ